MLDVSQILRNYARNTGVRLDIIEKDFAISYLLAAIAQTSGFGDVVVLKGGTALRKLFYPDYRFSEDLDYSTRLPGPIIELDKKMGSAIQCMDKMLNQQGPFQIQYELLTLREPHPDDQVSYIVRVRFPTHRQPLCRLKVEITVDELVLLPTENLPILHYFGEIIDVAIPSYALEEIVAEKLRALLQSKKNLVTRGWGASRVCRDYYDLWSVLRREAYFSLGMLDLLREKCAHRGVYFSSPDDFLSPELVDVANTEWTQQLLPFVLDAPPFEHILLELRTLIPDLLG
jgi:predicted nucleotidyltransferase component of viral defense system